MSANVPFRMLRVLAAAVVTLPLAACAGADGSREDRTGETVGTIVGAVGGAILGSRVGRGSVSTLGAVAGAALGAYVGSSVGRALDARDREMHGQAAENAMTRPPGEAVSWANPETGNSGSVTPHETVTRPSDGTTCRSFEQRITTKDGRTEAAEGTACREPDGTWRVVSG